MEFLIGIVTFNPLIKRLKARLELLANFEKDIVIVDNGSNNAEQIELLCNEIGVTFIGNKENKGIATALNEIFRFANENNISWVLTLDQDSLINERFLEKMEMYGIDQKNVGIYCPKIHDVVSNEFWPLVHSESKYIPIEKCITSGSLTSVYAWKMVDGFDEYLFIDEVDNDFCYRLREKNFRILLIPNIILDHKIGHTRVITIFGKKISVRNHSAMRKYYITRNRLYLDKKYYGKIKVKTLIMTILFVIKTMIFENNKFEKLKACNRGILDAFRN